MASSADDGQREEKGSLAKPTPKNGERSGWRGDDPTFNRPGDTEERGGKEQHN